MPTFYIQNLSFWQTCIHCTSYNPLYAFNYCICFSRVLLDGISLLSTAVAQRIPQHRKSTRSIPAAAKYNTKACLRSRGWDFWHCKIFQELLPKLAKQNGRILSALGTSVDMILWEFPAFAWAMGQAVSTDLPMWLCSLVRSCSPALGIVPSSELIECTCLST